MFSEWGKLLKMNIDKLSNTSWLEHFYSLLTDGDWEHQYGFSINNLDNPGWSFCADLNDTILEIADFKDVHELRTEADWIICKKEDEKFNGYGGAHNLEEILTVFRLWVRANLNEGQSPWRPELSK
jgi:hypothetical protein